MDYFKRTELLIGEDNFKKIENSSVAVFGIGGVGGFVCEALARSGVKNITIIDNDAVSITNINRQIIANVYTIGKRKVDVMEERLKSINPTINVRKKQTFFLPDTSCEIDFTGFDYIVDAVDTVSAKIEIIKKAKESGVPVISCMGTGGKIDPTKLKVVDIEKTKVCPLARVMRRELKNRDITGVKVVYSDEEPLFLGNKKDGEIIKKNRIAPPSMIFVPATAGIIIAQEIVKDIINKG
ncbi:MAG: tRNA threonylcarbamoyladenosine dehydratase [Clostridia bacterium]|nr:tRNA threonylcarbamoyladenosine dehydratase [Clostridia bacterium]